MTTLPPGSPSTPQPGLAAFPGGSPTPEVGRRKGNRKDPNLGMTVPRNLLNRLILSRGSYTKAPTEPATDCKFPFKLPLPGCLLSSWRPYLFWRSGCQLRFRVGGWNPPGARPRCVHPRQLSEPKSAVFPPHALTRPDAPPNEGECHPWELGRTR